MQFIQTVVTLPEPIHLAVLAGVTLLLGLVLNFVASKFPKLADLLGQYKEEVAVFVAGAIVAWVNGYLAQIPANWEGVALAALNLVIAVLAALGLILQSRKAKVAYEIKQFEKQLPR